MIEFTLGTAPVFVYLHEDLKEDRLVEELLERFAGLGAYLLKGYTLMADNDTLLRVALHVNYGIDVDVLVVFLESLYSNLYAIRYLLIVVEQNLFANYLRHEESCGFVGELVFIEIGRTLRQKLLNTLQQNIHTELILS